MKNKVSLSILILIVMYGCSTAIKTSKINDGNEGEGGIPYFLPKPMVQINEPLEIGREEELYAIISMGGLEEFLYKININEFDEAVKNLAELLRTEPKNIFLKGIRLNNIYKTEETVKDKEKTETNTKYGVYEPSEHKAIPEIYESTDMDKAIKIIFIPDPANKYELMIKPDIFANTVVDFKMADGWKFEGISVTAGDNTLVDALKEVVATTIGAQKEMKIAQIGKEQALLLKELEIKTQGEDDTETFTTKSKIIEVSIKGYLKKINFEILKPGLYDINSLIQDGKLVFPTENSVIYSPFKF